MGRAKTANPKRRAGDGTATKGPLRPPRRRSRKAAAAASATTVARAAPATPRLVKRTSATVPTALRTKPSSTLRSGPCVSLAARPAARATEAMMTKGCPQARMSEYRSAEGTTSADAAPAIHRSNGSPHLRDTVVKKRPPQRAMKRASETTRSDSDSLPSALAAATRFVVAVAMKKKMYAHESMSVHPGPSAASSSGPQYRPTTAVSISDMRGGATQSARVGAKNLATARASI
mmetsp:Transcript_18433/g.42061  ORF Transcript_18433/g.42061 Transcript_18433/m.42061 type:complete len:233 (+) Transcript_18433:1290-1988(+)